MRNPRYPRLVRHLVRSYGRDPFLVPEEVIAAVVLSASKRLTAHGDQRHRQHKYIVKRMLWSLYGFGRDGKETKAEGAERLHYIERMKEDTGLEFESGSLSNV